jgi:stage II sporulation protein AA (anti-sigma F factor antagonist)
MSDSTVTVSIRSDGDAVLVVIVGEIDLSNAETVSDSVAGALSNFTMRAVIDLSAVDYIDSIGMRVLFSLATRLETLQISLKLIAPLGSPARRVIEICSLDSIVDVDPPG